jgi:hypothetical protein
MLLLLLFTGKKWFLQPGLQAEEGSTVRQKLKSWRRHESAVVCFHEHPVSIVHSALIHGRASCYI